MSQAENPKVKPLETRGKLNIPKIDGKYVGPFSVEGKDGYFPGLQFAAPLVPLPRFVVPVEYSKPHFIETASQALQHESPLVGYLIYNEKGELLPESERGFGCITYPLQYEFTEDKKLRILLEFGEPVKVVSQKIDGNILMVGVDPVVQNSSGDPQEDLARIDDLLNKTTALLEKANFSEKVNAVNQYREASPFQKIIYVPYVLASLLQLPFATKVSILTCTDLSKRIDLVIAGVKSLNQD